MLKCEGFRSYQELSSQIVKFLELIKKEVPKTSVDTTKLFALNYHDIKQLIKLCSCFTNEMWGEEKTKIWKINLNPKFSIEEKSKIEILKDIE